MTKQELKAHRYLHKISKPYSTTWYITHVIESCKTLEQLEFAFDWAWSLRGYSLAFPQIRDSYSDMKKRLSPNDEEK